MRWPGIEELYGESLRQTKVFGPKGTVGVEGDIEETDAVGDQGDKRWEVLHGRVIEHVRCPHFAASPTDRSLLGAPQNIRTIAKYYTRITTSRLATLLDLTPAKAEEFLSRLVVNKTVYARIDRPAGIVNFKAPRSGDAVLNDWSSDVGKLMGLIEKSCHLIAKVRLVSSLLSGWTLTPPSPAGARGELGAEGTAKLEGVVRAQSCKTFA